MNSKEIKKNDKVKTIFGKIETVMSANGCQVITYESARQLNWYHIDKVWKI
jgi:hypothetical protein